MQHTMPAGGLHMGQAFAFLLQQLNPLLPPWRQACDLCNRYVLFLTCQRSPPSWLQSRPGCRTLQAQTLAGCWDWARAQATQRQLCPRSGCSYLQTYRSEH